jgi:phospholipase C
MKFCTTLTARILNGLAVLGMSIALLTGITPAFADGKDTARGQEIDSKLQRIGHIIVIYQENWSFDSLYGQFPGADGLANAFDTLPQYDKASPPYSQLIYKTPRPLNNGLVDPNFPGSVDGNLGWWGNPSLALPLIPYDFTIFSGVGTATKTGDLVHRFYHEQLQIDNGLLETKNGDLDKFVTWSDNPGLVLSYLDATDLPEGKLAQQYMLLDQFFHSAYGGSFLNHQWLIAAASPPSTPSIRMALTASTWNSVTKQLNDSNLTFDAQYVVNTTQPLLAPFSPGTVPAKRLLINNTVPSQPGYTPNIGNRLDDAGINWRWYSGGWNDALNNNVAANAELFQFHHQPFAYYTKYAPFAAAPAADYSATPPLNPATTGPNAHLQDEANFLADVASGKLPPVSFVKPIGKNNEHPGYTDELTGQQHVAALVKAVQDSKIWHDSVIIITYDENGGRWDHVVPPVRDDKWGVGVRVPAIIVSPFVRKGAIDSHEYETVSILKLIERRFNLKPLAVRDADPKVSDLTTAFDFEQED